jgi:HEAT repeat protein
MSQHLRFPAPFLAALLLLTAALPARADFLGKSAGDWLKELADKKPEVRRGAAFALGKCGLAGAVPKLVRALKDDDASVRDAAAYAIGEIAGRRQDGGGLWDEAGAPLRAMLKEEKDARARRSAACAIGRFGPAAAEARDELEQALGSPDAAVRQNAAWALGRLKDKAGTSGVDKLAQALRDDDASVRRDAAAALGEIGRPTAAGPAVRALVGCLVLEKAPEVRPVAVGSLVGLIGPDDKDVAGDLRGLLDDNDREVKRGTALALAKVGGAEAKPAVPILVELLGDDDATTRELAAAALGTAGEAAAEAVPALGKALSDRSPAVRRNAALALNHVGPEAGKVIRQLVRAMDKQEPKEVRQYAADALDKTDEAINDVVPELLAILKEDGDQLVRQRIVMALRHVRKFAGSDSARALEKVLDETGRNNRLVRYDAARVLAYVLRDEAPVKTVEILVEMLNTNGLLEYKGTDSTLSKGNESVRSGTGAKENLGGDGRFMAAQALGQIAATGKKKRPDALDALKAAAKSDDEVKKKVAADVLKEIGER